VKPRPLPQRREYLKDPALARVDQAREDLARQLSACPFLRGRLISVSFASNTRTVVRHDLGVAAACMIIRQDYSDGVSYGRLVESDIRDATPTKNLALVYEVGGTLDLWFYPRASKPVDAGQGQSL